MRVRPNQKYRLKQSANLSNQCKLFNDVANEEVAK